MPRLIRLGSCFSVRLARVLAPLLGLGLGLGALPAPALQRVELKLPLLETGFSLDLEDLASDRQPMSGTSDLAQLDQALDGLISRRLRELFLRPLPVQSQAVAGQLAGSALLEQALLAASTLGRVDGLQEPADSTALAAAVEKAAARGDLTLLALLQALPGQSVTVDLDQALVLLRRLRSQQDEAERLATSLPPATLDPALAAAGPARFERSIRRLVVGHRSEPLELVLYSPAGGAAADGPSRLVVISHGLWDGPESFEGWARHLASHGFTVALPRHPGSDAGQKQAMLSGRVPPPDPVELSLRPRDVSAVADALAGQAGNRIVVIGHSWGATTALQLAGAVPSSNKLRQRCDELDDPGRNLSWVLQCSFLSSADRSGAGDRRVIAAVAVSPPLSLLFDQGAAASMHGRTLLVSGSRDWVVPPDVEAIEPFGRTAAAGHALVLVKGGDHFNLRAPAAGTGGPLAALLLAWVQAAFAAGEQARPAPQAPALLPAGGWGDSALPMVEVRPQSPAAALLSHPDPARASR